MEILRRQIKSESKNLLNELWNKRSSVKRRKTATHGVKSGKWTSSSCERATMRCEMKISLLPISPRHPVPVSIGLFYACFLDVGSLVYYFVHLIPVRSQSHVFAFCVRSNARRHSLMCSKLNFSSRARARSSSFAFIPCIFAIIRPKIASARCHSVPRFSTKCFSVCSYCLPISAAVVHTRMQIGVWHCCCRDLWTVTNQMAVRCASWKKKKLEFGIKNPSFSPIIIAPFSPFVRLTQWPRMCGIARELFVCRRRAHFGRNEKITN